MIVDVLTRISDGDAGDEEECRAHAALFVHVGVTNPADWRAVALALAKRYAPETLTVAALPKPRRKKAGRPEKWDALAKGCFCPP